MKNSTPVTIGPYEVSIHVAHYPYGSDRYHVTATKAGREVRNFDTLDRLAQKLGLPCRVYSV